MKGGFIFSAIALSSLFTLSSEAQSQNSAIASDYSLKHLYLDVHHIGAGKVTAKDVAGAHQKDLAIQKKYGVNFVKYWIDEANGNVYCLAEARDSNAIRKTHAEAHGLVPDLIQTVVAGDEERILGKKDLYLDLHVMGPGKVNAAAVAGAHKKDLAVQKKHKVRFINYWLDEKNGVIMCLAQANSGDAVVDTHKEAHGLVPVRVDKVKQGQ